ncbi:hypothetical protein, partial [Novosphingobium sp.]|uniref:hypothetical protein n=1 Tax=Novosphingobium sp. TaxID=1874826 RepID=UPI0035B11F98
GYGRTQPIHDRGGKSATTHHRKGRLTMTQGHRRNYTTLTDVTANYLVPRCVQPRHFQIEPKLSPDAVPALLCQFQAARFP